MNGRNNQSLVRRIETSGIPRRPDTSAELREKFARHLGIIPTEERLQAPLPERFTEIDLGNPDLPIYGHLHNLVDAVDTNPVTICVGETGSGKSTQLPQALLQRGYRVTLTQPRRIAAEMLAARIADELADPEKLGPGARMLVGYQTAERNTITPDTRVSVVTDGLQLVQELGVFDKYYESDEPEVLIVDEVHERNKNIDTLIAWTQMKVAEGANLRVVYMTASMNAERLARHYAKVGVLPPIYEVPGRTFPIEKYERPDSTVAEEVAKLAMQGKNTLVFLPGVTEIEDAIRDTHRLLKGSRDRFHFQRLHGKLSPYEQQQISIECEGVRLVFATNAAETSITIPDVDAVVDSGLERRIEIDDDGVESLRVGVISQASCKQRSGRCGRTKEGTYVSTRLNGRVEYVQIIQRPEYSVPEILRSNVDKTVLSIAATDLDISKLDMLDKIDDKVILRSKRALQTLGALDENYRITDRGRRMNKYPIRPSLSRMVVYGIENNFSEEVRSYIAAIAAAVESGGLPDYGRDSGNEWKKLISNKNSDLLAQLDMFIAVQGMSARDLADSDFNVRAVERAQELYEKLLRRSKIRLGEALVTPNESEKEQIIEAITAGMIDFVYERSGSEFIRTVHKLGRKATKEAATPREIGDRSIVSKRGVSLVVANPYALAPPPGREELPERHIIQDITVTTPEVLSKVALELCEMVAVEKEGAREVIWRDGVPYILYKEQFRGTVDTGRYQEIKAEWTVQLAREVIEMLRKHPGRNLRRILDTKKESERLWHRSGTTTPIHNNKVTEVLEREAGITKKSLPQKPMNPGMLDEALAPYVSLFEAMLPSADEQHRINESSPDFIDIDGISISLGYRKGIPRVAKVTDELKADLLTLPRDLALPDGREIMIPHATNGRNSRDYTLAEFRTLRG